MATFKIVLDKRLEVEKDKFHLVVRVSHQGSNIYLRLGSQMTVKEYDAIFTKKSFDKKMNSIKESYQKYITRAEKIFEDVQPFNQSEFRKKYFDKTIDLDKIVTPEMKEMGSIVYLFKNYIKVKTESKEIGLSTAQLLQGTLNNLNKFKQGLTYEDITP
jgi:hypothetical protein